MDILGSIVAFLVGFVPGLPAGYVLSSGHLLTSAGAFFASPLAVSFGTSMPASVPPILGSLYGAAGPLALLGDTGGNIVGQLASSIFRSAYGLMAGAA